MTREALGADEPASDVQTTFEIAWEPAPPERAPDAPAHWMILTDRDGLGEALAAKLRSRATAVSLVRPGSGFSRTEAGWVIDPTDLEHWQQLHQAIAGRGEVPVDAVLALWPIDETAAPDSLEVIEAAHRRILEPLLTTIQAAGEGSARLWIATRGSQAVSGSRPDLMQAPAWALAGVAAAEYPLARVSRIDLDPARRPDDIDLLLACLTAADGEDRIALRDGARLVARLRPITPDPAETPPRRLEIPARGSLANLVLMPVERPAPGPGEVEIRIFATGLNFRDVLNALGMYPGDPGPLGNECAGVVTAIGDGVEDLAVGDQVLAMTDRSFATYVTAPANLTVIKPRELSYAAAATLPVTFLTADYALHDIGAVKPGDRVLIHAVTGGVGMAATQIALAAGAEVIGTASAGKRDLALAMGVAQVFDSRSLSFADDVARVTGGEGVDIVLNSLSGDFIPATLALLREGGRFVEIGKSDGWDAEQVAEAFPGVAYTRLYLGEVTEQDPSAMRARLARITADCAAGGLVPAAVSDLSDRQGGRCLPLHGPGPAHRQSRHHPAPSAAGERGRELPDHRRARRARPRHRALAGERGRAPGRAGRSQRSFRRGR